MTRPTPHGQVPARHQYTSDLASKCQGVARCISRTQSQGIATVHAQPKDIGLQAAGAAA